MTINNLLPKIEELKPIVDSRDTFNDTPFIRDFNILADGEKLQVLADIVKQTMIYDEVPNPKYEETNMIGDDYTSSLVFIDYVKSLGLFEDVQLVLVSNKKNIDIKDHFDCHFSVLVKDINDKQYLVDATPDIGYGIGEVNDFSEKDLYNKYIVIDEDMKKIIDLIRTDMYDIHNKIYNDTQVENYKKIRKILYKDIFNGLLLKYYKCVMKSNHTKFKRVMRLDFHDKINEITDISLKNNLSKLSIVNGWWNTLKNMSDNSVDYKKQQKLAQLICSENNLVKTMNINGTEVKLNHITPRFLWELGYNVVIIKSSAYLVGIEASCENCMIPKISKKINSYMTNLGEKNIYGLRPMAYFHPHGLKYEFQMTGPNKVILVDDNSEKLNERKIEVRNTKAQLLQNRLVNWFNGEKIVWDTELNTNLVHATDNAIEASIHLLAGYPEYQSFTRFNYPNPVLRKEKIR